MKTLNLVDNRANGGNLTLGAENTNAVTVSDSRLEVGLTISGFLPGVAGNKIPGFGEYLLADTVRFFQLPGAFFMPGKHIEASANKITALKKRSTVKGTNVFSALIFRVPMVYPFTLSFSNLDTLAGKRDNLTVGARNTNKRTVSDSRFEVGFLLSGFNAGSSREYNTRTAGNTCWPIFCGFSSYPALSSCPESNEETPANKITALEKRSKRKGTTVFLHPLLGVPAAYPLTTVPAHRINVEGVAA